MKYTALLLIYFTLASCTVIKTTSKIPENDEDFLLLPKEIEKKYSGIKNFHVAHYQMSYEPILYESLIKKWGEPTSFSYQWDDYAVNYVQPQTIGYTITQGFNPFIAGLFFGTSLLMMSSTTTDIYLG